MPEIVEAEKLVRQLRPAWVGHRITTLFAVHKEDGTFVPFLKNKPKGSLSALTNSAVITGVGRAGKQILIHFRTTAKEDYIWRIHLGHTGWWLPGNDLAKERTTRDPIADNFIHTLPKSTIRAMLMLSDGQRHDFYDPRTFSRWYVHTPNEWQVIHYKEFGPDWMTDPQDASEAVIRRIRNLNLTGSQQTTKEVLLDQKVAAGLGNYMVCEILYRAGIHPHTPATQLNKNQINRIVIETPGFIATSFTSPDHSHWLVFQRLGVLCKTCRTTYIERIPEGTRSSYFCRKCQPYDRLRR